MAGIKHEQGKFIVYSKLWWKIFSIRNQWVAKRTRTSWSYLVENIQNQGEKEWERDPEICRMWYEMLNWQCGWYCCLKRKKKWPYVPVPTKFVHVALHGSVWLDVTWRDVMCMLWAKLFFHLVVKWKFKSSFPHWFDPVRTDTSYRIFLLLSSFLLGEWGNKASCIMYMNPTQSCLELESWLKLVFEWIKSVQFDVSSR
jgi:hypothetical protein